MKAEIEDKLERLEERVKQLRSYSDISKEDLKDDSMLRSASERNFQVALEIVLDICSMIISREDMEKPEDYRSMIRLLGEEDILDEEFAKRFQNAASFRNILVHQYADIDLDKLHKYLTENLEDFDTFTREVAKYAKNQKD